MKINSRVFGEAEIDAEKIITFPGGIIGFPDLQRFALMFDEEKGTHNIQWLQSIDEPAFAMPVMDPLLVKPDYNPEIDDDVLKEAMPLTPDNMLVLVTATVPKDITKMTVNLMGPIVINADTKKACQVIVSDNELPVKFPIYDILKKMKEQSEQG